MSKVKFLACKYLKVFPTQISNIIILFISVCLVIANHPLCSAVVIVLISVLVIVKKTYNDTQRILRYSINSNPLLYSLPLFHSLILANKVEIIISSLFILLLVFSRFLYYLNRNVLRIRTTLLKETFALDVDYSFVSVWFILIYLAVGLCQSLVNLSPTIYTCLRVIDVICLVAFLMFVTFKRVLFLLKNRASIANTSEVYKAIEKYNPKFAIFFSARVNTEYQYYAWKKYLDKIGEKYVIITPELFNYRNLKAVKDNPPIVFAKRMKEIEDLFVDSISTVFYVNNGAKNVFATRLIAKKHILLLHGDSDKSSSFNPMARTYSKVYVAGQGGRDRYANHGIEIPDDRFEIIGRPQVTELNVGKRDESNVVVVAPSWHGNTEETADSFILIADKIVKKLIKNGYTVIFRPHPYSYKRPDSLLIIRKTHKLLEEDAKKTDRKHQYGATAENKSFFENANDSDLLISDMSSVANDYLYTEKPIILVSAMRDVEEFKEKYPIATYTYTVDSSLKGFDEIIADIRQNDSNSPRIREAKDYYLGGFDQENYDNVFIEVAKKDIN